MNKLNPIYIIALLLVLLLVSSLHLNNKKNEFEILNKSFESLETKINGYKDYKKNWINEKKVVSKLNSILRSSKFRNEKILKTQSGKIIKVKIESLNQKLLNSFLNRVLNQKFVLRKLQIKKSSIYLEIRYKKWKKF